MTMVGIVMATPKLSARPIVSVLPMRFIKISIYSLVSIFTADVYLVWQ